MQMGIDDERIERTRATPFCGDGEPGLALTMRTLWPFAPCA